MPNVRLGAEVPGLTMLDFNDAPSLNPATLEPDREALATYLGVIAEGLDGWLPFRGFIDQGQAHTHRPYNEWIDLNHSDAVSVLYTMSAYAAGHGIAAYCIPGSVTSRGEAKARDVHQIRNILVDIDAGEIHTKLAHLAQWIGTPTLIIESGGRTKDGADKLHVYWSLDEVAEGEDLDRVAKLRHLLAVKCGTDTHFQSLHQPIRIPGSVYHKHGHTRLVTIRAHNPVEYSLDDLIGSASDMPALTAHGGSPFDFNEAGRSRLGLDAALGGTFNEGGEGENTRFAALSAVIGHEVRMWHDGRQSEAEAWEKAGSYNEARITPPWPAERLRSEFERLKAKHLAENGPANAPKAQPGDASLPLIWFDDIEPNLDSRDFVEGVLCDGEMSVLYGESNSGKTFFATDLAYHVAIGAPWRERDVEAGGVVYCALEGGAGIKNRLAALKQRYGVCDVPLAVVPAAIDLLKADADTERLIALVQAAAERLNVPMRLVVIDTLSRALAGGNENASDDMGALVRNADRIRQTLNVHLQFVHHSGKDAAKGARGHSLLRAATDTEIEISRDADLEVSSARVTKQRELEGTGEFGFKLESVLLGTNRRGKPVTSCVVVAAQMGALSRLDPEQALLVEALREAIEKAGRDLQFLADQTPAVSVGKWKFFAEHRLKRDLSDSAFSNRTSRLVHAGLVKKERKEKRWLAALPNGET